MFGTLQGHQKADTLEAKMNQLANATAKKKKAQESVAMVQIRYSNDQTWKAQGDYAVWQSTGEVRWVLP